MWMKLAVDKTIMLSSGPNNSTWKFSDNDQSLEVSLVAKYLGIELCIKGRNRIKSREHAMIKITRNYTQTIFGCTKLGLDRVVIAHKLWESCAIPSILYASEAIVVPKTTIKELEKIQNSVRRFFLQLPSSSARVVGFMNAELGV